MFGPAAWSASVSSWWNFPMPPTSRMKITKSGPRPTAFAADFWGRDLMAGERSVNRHSYGIRRDLEMIEVQWARSLKLSL